MKKRLHPWEVDRALLPERLQQVAVEVKKARHEVIDLRVDGRDNPWCISCRCYQWTRAFLVELAGKLSDKWLHVDYGGLACTFYVGGVPFKFYRGPADQPNARTLRSGVREMLAQGRLGFSEDEIAAEIEGWFWLMAIDTDVDGRVLDIVVFQANAQGEHRHPWSVPLDGRVVAISSVTDLRREGVDQEPAEVGIPEAEITAKPRAGNDEK